MTNKIIEIQSVDLGQVEDGALNANLSLTIEIDGIQHKEIVHAYDGGGDGDHSGSVFFYDQAKAFNEDRIEFDDHDLNLLVDFEENDRKIVTKAIEDEALKMDKAGIMTDWCEWLSNYQYEIYLFINNNEREEDINYPRHERIRHYIGEYLRTIDEVKEFEREHNCVINNEFKSMFEKCWDDKEALKEMVEDMVNRLAYKG
jgi:hypothetical protein